MTDPLTIIHGDALSSLRAMPDESVQCVVTSPPYWGLRDYGTAAWVSGDSTCSHDQRRAPKDGKQSTNVGSARDRIVGEDCRWCGAIRVDVQIGLEKRPEEYVAKLDEIFCEAKRVLRNDGVLWLNLGDTYATGTTAPRQLGTLDFGVGTMKARQIDRRGTPDGMKTKDLVGIPWMVAFALRANGWYLRSDIVWSKPNPMPESVKDRPTRSHEYIFLLTKSERYYYDADAIAEPAQLWTGQAAAFERSKSRFARTISGAASSS